MSTRCIITIEGFDVAALYKHSDGYPSATLPWLLAFNKRWAGFGGNRKNDTSYKFAQLLRDTVFSAENFDLVGSRETGWGVVPYDMDCQQEYTYELKANGEVTYEKH